MVLRQIHQTVEVPIHDLESDEVEMLHHRNSFSLAILLELYEKNRLSSWYFGIIGYNRTWIVPLFFRYTSVGRS